MTTSKISCQLIVACGDDEEALAAAKNGARAQISFLCLHARLPAGCWRTIGRGDLQEELNVLSKQGEWLQMAARIEDDLLEQIAVVGSSAEIPGKLRERCAGFAARVSPVRPPSPANR